MAQNIYSYTQHIYAVADELLDKMSHILERIHLYSFQNYQYAAK